MINTQLVSTIKEVPRIWVFSHYCGVPIDKFDGSRFKIKSIYNKREKIPSLSFYIKNGQYRFNDFSTGFGGDHIDLIQRLDNIPYSQACIKIINDYNEWKLHGGEVQIKEFKEKSKYRVESFEERLWTRADQIYWTSYCIGSSTLERFNVKPLKSYSMTNDEQTLFIEGDHLYGYFKQDGTLYKIYQPMVERSKFIKVEDYIQGSEQTQHKPYLLYLSSLKDIMSADALKINTDFKAPDSENTLIPHDIIEKDIREYKWVGILFDVDEPGIKAAKKYQEKYGLTPIFLNYGEKDLSDHVKKFGINRVRQWLVPLIDKKINLDKCQG